jgi:hypothetical protein
VEEASIEMYLAGVSVRRVEDISEALWGSRVSKSFYVFSYHHQVILSSSCLSSLCTLDAVTKSYYIRVTL